MYTLDYLLRGNTQSDFNAMVRYLKNKGYEFPDNGGNPTYKNFRSMYGNKVVLLIEGTTEDNGSKKQIIVTYLSKINKIHRMLNIETYSMRDVQTVIPVEFYEGVIK